MTTVADVFGHRQPRLSSPHPKLAFNANIGVELEIEGVQHLEVPYWNCTEDGSLREGCELVCAEPYSGEMLYTAIETLSESVSRSRAQGTWRCSTHVHLDVRDCDSNIVKKIILAWAFYEKMMFKCSGFHRYRSNFCPAFAVVQAQLINASTSFNREDGRFLEHLVNSWDKYTSLNVLPLAQFGSVEFRISEPKWKRTNLLNLVNRFLVLKKLAVENSEMENQAFIDMLQQVGFEPMLEYLPLDYLIDDKDLEDGYVLANDILHVRHRDVVLVPRVRMNQLSPEQIDEHRNHIREIISNNYGLYADHTLGKHVRYRHAFHIVFGTTNRSDVEECSIGQLRRLMELWREIAEERGREDAEIIHTVISGWTQSLEHYLDEM